MELLVGWLLAPRDRCWSAGEEGEAPVGPGGGLRQGGEDGQHAGGDPQPPGAQAHRQEPRRCRLHCLGQQQQALLLPRLLTSIDRGSNRPRPRAPSVTTATTIPGSLFLF